MSRVWRQWHVCCRQAHLGRAQQDGALHATTLPVPLTANISAPVTLMGFTSHQIGTRGDLPSANSLSFKFLFTFPMPCKMAGQLCGRMAGLTLLPSGAALSWGSS